MLLHSGAPFNRQQKSGAPHGGAGVLKWAGTGAEEGQETTNTLEVVDWSLWWDRVEFESLGSLEGWVRVSSVFCAPGN